MLKLLFNKKYRHLNLRFFIWYKNNRHHNVIPTRSLDFSRISIGAHSFGELDVLMDNKWQGDEKLIIGSYCSIAPNVHFLLASEHPYQGISTFPFKVKFGLQKREAKGKGDIIVGDDVWIGYGAIINSGVKIGQGAIIAAGSVVVKDVEPYSIVGGNPAKHIKYRFDEPIRKKLINFDFSKLEKQKVIDNIDLVYEKLTNDNVDEILNKLVKE